METSDRAQAPHPPSPAPVFPECTDPAGFRRETFPAMGTTVTVLLPRSHALMGMATVRALFADWEQRLSRFLPESELSRLNGRAGETVRWCALAPCSTPS